MPNQSHLQTMLSSQTLRQRVVGQACRMGLPLALAEDVAQDTLLELWTYAMPIRNLTALVSTITRRLSIRAAMAARCHIALEEVAESTDHEYLGVNSDAPSLDPVHAGTAVLRCFAKCRLPLTLQRYLIMQVALFADSPPLSDVTELVCGLIGKSRRTIQVQRRSAQDAALRLCESLAEELAGEQLGAEMLCDLLQNPEQALRSPELGRLIAETAADLAEQLVLSGKCANIVHILRSGAEKHNADEKSKVGFSRFTELLYASARIRRRYMVAGVVVHLHRRIGKIYQPHQLIDDSFVEKFLYSIVISGTKELDIVDHWIATVTLGGHYENMGFTVLEAERALEEVEQTSKGHPLSEIGAMFNWVNVARHDREAVLHHKVYRVMNPDAAGRFACLPITLFAPYLGKSGAGLEAISRDQALWETTLKALESPSQVAQLGGLIQLEQMPSIKTESAFVRFPLVNVLYKIISANRKNPIMQARAKILLENYKNL